MNNGVTAYAGTGSMRCGDVEIEITACFNGGQHFLLHPLLRTGGVPPV